jgi:hypothetical protein
MIMAGDDLKAVRILEATLRGALADHGRESARDPVDETVPAEVGLPLAALIGDDDGEIVLFNDSGLRSLSIHTDSAVVATGQAGAHVTAGGEDVTGFNFVTFDNGLTLYFEEGLDLVVAAGSEHSPETEG